VSRAAVRTALVGLLPNALVPPLDPDDQGLFGR